MSTAADWRPPRVRQLAGGLTVGLVERRQTPVVSTVLCYRAAATAEGERELGVAHFLEHMMFKGSARYGPGEVDRVTQRYGGDNNAYTGHDATLYQFSFAGDRWREALRIEADRMAGLRLDPQQIEAERAVILEELSMLEDDPWDALELAVLEAFYGDHPYARPVLGRRATVEAIGRSELERFHRRHYRPGNAFLAIAGDVGDEVFGEAEELFAGIGDGGEGGRPLEGRRRPPVPAARRVERRRGELARLLVALPAPPAGRSGHAALRVVLTALAGGRTSRLHELLVEERRLCSSVGAEISETTGPGMAAITCELLPGASPPQVEALLLATLDRAGDGLASDEISRSRRQLAADWAFGRETVAQEAMAAATALALFGADYPRRHLEEIESCSARLLRETARRYLAPAGGCVGWSLPETGSRHA